MATTTSTTPSWVSGIVDTGIQASMTAAFTNGMITQNGMGNLFTALTNNLSSNNTTLTASQLNDLKLIASNLNSSNTSEYVSYITNALVNGNPANAIYTGGQAISVSLGNLAAGSSSTNLFELNSKWFLGTDLPQNYFVSANLGTDTLNPGTTTTYFSYLHTDMPLYSNSDHSPSFNDVMQGRLGDCYLLSPLSEIAQQNPSAINNMITDNGNGTYGVRFFVNGSAQYVTTSSNFPVEASINQPIFNKYNLTGAMWPNIVENAYAQIQAGGNITETGKPAGNSFTDIDGGHGNVTLAQVIGSTDVKVYLGSKSANNWSLVTANSQNSNNITSSQMFDLIQTALNSRNDVTIASNTEQFGFNNWSTLETNHDMAVIGVDTNTKSLIIRNPWGPNPISLNPHQTIFEITLDTLTKYNDKIYIDNAGSIIPANYTNNDVNNWYQAVQYQNSPSSSTTQTVSQLNNGQINHFQVWDQIIGSQYTQKNVNPVITAYETVFGRIPDRAGEQFWVGQTAEGLATSKLYYNFTQSAEFQNLFKATGDTKATVATVTQMYINAFGSLDAQADTAGINWWASQNLPNWKVLEGIGTSAQAANWMSGAILGFELTQIAGNSGNIPCQSLYVFGGGA